MAFPIPDAAPVTSAMREACAGVVADESKRKVVALLRGALRQKLLRAGWSTDEVTRGIAIILPKAA